MMKKVCGALVCFAALAMAACGGTGTGDTVDSTGRVTENQTSLRACTYTPYAGAKKACVNANSASQCTKFNYGTVGDEAYSTYSTCAQLGY